MLRAVLGVVIGLISWMVAFYLLALGLAYIWPDYAIHGRMWMRQHVFTFTPAMACTNLVLWVLSEVVAGWVTIRLSKRREAVWILAALVGIYLAVLHVTLWARFPWWYNLGVILPTIPAVLLGGGTLPFIRRGKTGIQ